MEPPAKQYVAGFLFSKDKKSVALIQKLKPEWQCGLFNGIGGKIEDGETPLDAMRREFREEAGVDIQEWMMFCELRWRGGVVYFFRATGDLSGLVTMTEEQVRRIPVEFLPGHKTVPNLAWLVPMAMDKSGVTAVVNDPS